MWWMCGSPMWRGWWIFPMIALIFMAVMFFACSSFFRGKGGFCSMRRYDDIEDLKREVGELREEVTKLKKSGG
jgi:hypothetical protein